MATAESYTNDSGLRQDLLNQLKLIQESKTPLVSRLKSSVAKQRTHEWASDRITTSSHNDGGSAALEGAAFSATAVSDFTQSTNWCQIIREDFAISGTMEASDYAGLKSTVAYQKKKSLKSIGVRLEVAILQGTGNVGAASTTRRIKGLAQWATDAAVAVATGEASAFSASAGEELFLDLLQALFNKGKEIDFAYVHGTQKRAMDKWTLNVVKNVDFNKTNNVLRTKIAVYESSFGTTELLYTPAQKENVVVVGCMDDLRIAYLRRPFSEAQGKNGDAWPVMVLLEATLEVLDPSGVGVLTLS